MQDITGKRVAILATHGFEQSELEVPLKKLKEASAEVHVVSPEKGEIRGWQKKDWGPAVKVDRSLEEVEAAQYDALVLPGGQMNPDTLRIDQSALEFVRNFWREGKVVGAICHAPWLLVETGIARGRKVTSWPSLRTDLENAGGKWEDSSVVTDEGLVTSRNPDDLDAFCDKLTEEISEGDHQRQAA